MFEWAWPWLFLLLPLPWLVLRWRPAADERGAALHLPYDGVLDPAELKSKCKNTPFDEAKLTGRVVRTIVAGRTVYEYV